MYVFTLKNGLKTAFLYRNVPVSPEVVISHVVDEEQEDKSNRDEFRFVASSDHEHQWNTEKDGDNLRKRVGKRREGEGLRFACPS